MRRTWGRTYKMTGRLTDRGYAAGVEVTSPLGMPSHRAGEMATRILPTRYRPHFSEIGRATFGQRIERRAIRGRHPRDGIAGDIEHQPKVAKTGAPQLRQVRGTIHRT